MKRIFFLSCLLLSCAQRNEELRESSPAYSSPQAAMTSMIKAMNTQDSTTLKTILSQKTGPGILSQITKKGGFSFFFSLMKGFRLEMNIIGVDSSNPELTKVITHQTIFKDSAQLLAMDSIVFPAIKEEGSWKMLSLNGQPAKMFGLMERSYDSSLKK